MVGGGSPRCLLAFPAIQPCHGQDSFRQRICGAARRHTPGPVGTGKGSGEVHPGFGAQIQNSWLFSVASIQGIIAKENVTSTIETLAGVIGQEDFSGVVAASFAGHSELDIAASLSAFAVFNMTTIPCFASVATAKAELGKGKTYVGTVAFWIVCSYLMGCLTYVTIRWVWTLAISIPVIALLFVLAFLYSGHKNKKEAKEA